MEMWHKMENDVAIWNIEFCKKLKFVYRKTVSNIQTIKSVAKWKKKKDNPQTSMSIQVKVTRTRFTFLLKTTSLPKKQNMQIYERTTLKILDIR